MLSLPQLRLGTAKTKGPLNVTVTDKTKDATSTSSSDSENELDGVEHKVMDAKAAIICALPVQPKAQLTESPVIVTKLPTKTKTRSRRSGRESLLWLSDDHPAVNDAVLEPICKLPVEKREHVLTKRIEIVVTRTCPGLEGAFGEIVDQMGLVDLLQFIAEQRLRLIPHQGSRLDLVLRWAASFAKSVNDCCVLFSQSIHGLPQFASYTYGATKLLIETAILSNSAVDCVYAIMSMLEQMGSTLDYFGRQRYYAQDSSAVISLVGASCSDLLDFCASVSVRAKSWASKSSKALLLELEAELSLHVETFYERKQQLVLQIWSESLAHHRETVGTTVQTLQAWLNIKLQSSSTSRFVRHLHKAQRHEQSYEWFYETLRSFRSSKQHVLLLSGQAASGKSALMAYILEQLQCPRAGFGNCDVVRYNFESRMQDSFSVFSMLKTWALQLLEADAGDCDLYRCLATAYAAAQGSQRQHKAAESALWTAIEASLRHVRRPIVFLIDSLDRCAEFETVFGKIQELAAASSSGNCQFIVSSRTHNLTLTSRCRYFDIEAHNHTDIRRYFELELRSLAFEEEHLLELIHECRTLKIETFLQAQLFVQIIRRQKTLEAIRAVLVKLGSHGHEHIDLCCEAIDFKSEQTRLVFSVLLASKRALSIGEMAELLRIKGSTLDRKATIDVDHLIQAHCGGLVTTRGGYVCFTHEKVAAHLLSLCRTGKLGFALEDGHRTLVLRALAYIKVCFGNAAGEPSLTCTLGKKEQKHVDELIKKHAFLEYAVQNWIFHYRYSALYDMDECPSDFQAVFSGSVYLAVLEGSVWHVHHQRQEEADAFYQLALDLRRRILGEKHKCVVQALINVSHSHVRHSQHAHGHRDLVAAWQLAIDVCGKQSAVCVALAEYYVEVVMKLEEGERQQHLSVCGKMYRFLWEHYKRVHSEHHERAVYYAQCLVEVHIALEEHEQAICVLREIRTITTKQHGHFHASSVKITQLLLTVLSKTSQHDECHELCQAIIKASAEELDCWHADRLSMTLRMVELHEQQHRLEAAERLLVALRLELIEACKKRHEEHIHEAKIELSIQLARFLKRCQREKEAQALLAELWAEYEKPIHGHSEHSHSLLLKIKLVGECMKEWGVYTAAKHVFGALCGWFKKKGSSKEVVDVSIGLSHCHHHCHDTKSEEGVLVELWETLLAGCSAHETSVVEVTVITTATELVAFYGREHRWSEARDVCVRLLRTVWRDFFASGGSSSKCGLPRQHRVEVVRLVLQLGQAHVHLGSVREAVQVFVSVFRACKQSLGLADALVLETATRLATCYEEHGLVDEALEMWLRLRDETRALLGARHDSTIRVLYQLAHLCQRQARPGAEQHLLDIAVAFGFGEHACHAASVEAVLALCKMYQRQRRAGSAVRKCYYSLWLAFQARGLGCGIDHGIVLDIFVRYLALLQAECARGDDVVAWACEFRQACVRHFGAAHWLAVRVSLDVAELVGRDAHRHAHAVELYEGLLKLRLEQQEAQLAVIKQRLARLYCRHAHDCARAEPLLLECWRHAVAAHGHAHERSCEALRAYVDVLVRLNQRPKAVKHLHTVLVAILQAADHALVDARRLHACAHVVARLYASLQSTPVLLQLVREVRLQLHAGQRSSPAAGHGGCLVSATGAVSAGLLLFLYTLEDASAAGDGPLDAYDECMALVCEEQQRWEAWLAVHAADAALGVVLAAGVRLLHTLLLHRRAHDADAVLARMWTLFCASLSIQATARAGAVYELFTLYLASPVDAAGALPDLLPAAVDIIIGLYAARSFALCLSLSQWFHGHVKTRCGGYAAAETRALCIRLAMCLTGRAHAHVLCLDSRVVEFGQTLFVEMLHEQLAHRKLDFVHACELRELECMVVMLGERKAYKELEQMLAYIWETRHQSRLDSAVLLNIAHRLVQVKFAAGSRRAAMALAEDVVYNLRRVFGPADPVTVQFTELLASIYEECGEHAKAAGSRQHVLQVCLEADADDCDGDGDGPVYTVEQRARLAHRAAAACQRLEFEDADLGIAVLVKQAKEAFEDIDESWKELDSESTWGRLPIREQASFGCWQSPKVWSLTVCQ